MSVKTPPTQTTGGIDDLSTELKTISVLCSAVPEINEDLRELSDHVDDLDDHVSDLEEGRSDLEAKITDLGQAFGQLATNVTALEETVEEEVATLQARQDELEARLDAVEGCLNPELLEKQTAHVEAQGRSMPFDRGDEFDFIVEEVQGRPNSTLRGQIKKVQTFVDVDNPAEYEEGDVVDVTITDLNETAAHAVPTEVFGE